MIEAERSAALNRVPGVAHGFYGRRGGISTGLYGSLNCGLGSLDERANVLANRARVVGDLLGPSSGAQLLTAYQVHSAEAVIVDKPWAPEAQPKLDGLVTRTRGLVLGALAADCTPVLLADGEAGVIGALHAGWKGALAGIVEATVAKMVEAGARRARITAAIGPTITQPNYEVGPEFQAQFVSREPDFSRFFWRNAATGKPHFDLPGFVEMQLQRSEVGTVDRCTTCTYANPEQYFSYRRTTHQREPDYGRQVSAIALV
ncbi:MAG: laccase domain protein YfiH [Pseudomonadota bacterium]